MSKSAETYMAEYPPSECATFVVSPTAPFAIPFQHFIDHGSIVCMPTQYPTIAQRGNNAGESFMRMHAQSLTCSRDNCNFNFNSSQNLWCGSNCDHVCSNAHDNRVTNISVREIDRSSKKSGNGQYPRNMKSMYHPDLLSHDDYMRYQVVKGHTCLHHSKHPST